MTRIASFHLLSERATRAPLALARLATDRGRLRSVDGLRFVRLLGTSRGDRTAMSIQPARTAVFAVWEDESALDRFFSTHPVASRWRGAAEAWHVRLRSLGGHGSWRGVDVLDGLVEGSTGGPIAVVTRADISVRGWKPFTGAGRRLDVARHEVGGRLALVGIGEAPVGRLGTFSLWSSESAMQSFARSAVHADVVARTRAENWYREEFFARFEPFASSGSWNGVDPLAARLQTR